MKVIKNSDCWHWVLAVVVGAVLRIVGALSGIGPFAADDYEWGIQVGYQWFLDPNTPFLSEFRSPLMGRLVAGGMSIGQACGISEPIHLLQCAYLILGLISLAGIPAAFYLAKSRWGMLEAKAAAWSMAIFALMPRITTRALIGVVAMIPILWGFLFLEKSFESQKKSFRLALIGTLVVGVGAVIRYQVGILLLAVLVYFAVGYFRDTKNEKKRSQLFGVLVGGILLIVLQGGIDWSVGRTPLEGLVNYLRHNLEHSTNYGMSSWWTYLGHFLLYALGPLALFLIKPFGRAILGWPLVGFAFSSFVVLHSLIPHKEERFMFPVLGLFLVLLAPGIIEFWSAGGWKRKFVYSFACLQFAGALIAATSDSLSARTHVLADVARQGEKSIMAVVGIKHLPTFYGLGKIEFISFPISSDFLDAYSSKRSLPNYVLIREDKMYTASRLKKLSHCRGPKHYPGDWVDQTARWLNPTRNKRRMGNYLWDCRTKSAATGVSLNDG